VGQAVTLLMSVTHLCHVTQPGSTLHLLSCRRGETSSCDYLLLSLVDQDRVHKDRVGMDGSHTHTLNIERNMTPCPRDPSPQVPRGSPRPMSYILVSVSTLVAPLRVRCLTPTSCSVSVSE
jgi:hypothetical protein